MSWYCQSFPGLAACYCMLITVAAGATGRIPATLRSTGSLATKVPSSVLQRRTEIRPILFVKTHKTGSTSVANIVFRLGESRNQTFMLNCHPDKCNGHLGWPRAFPGSDADNMFGPPAHQFDIICNHAVYNDESMRTYLRHDPFVFTVLRDPLARLESSFEYFPEYASLSSWADRVRKLARLDPNSRASFRMRNSQAHDLGWHEWTGGTDKDERDDIIMEWISGLDQNLSFALLTEHFDEGLVLLRKKLGLELSDIRYLRVDPRGAAQRRELAAKGTSLAERTPPNAAQSAALARHLHVDNLLYTHFNQSFWREWEAAGGWMTLGADVRELRAQNDALAQACANKACSWRFMADDTEYPLALYRATKASRPK